MDDDKLFRNLKHDLPASLVVFLVAVPLCLGIALASGAPLFAGIIAGIVGGIVVGIASGSPLGVSGPAAGLAVIVLSSIQELGSFKAFLPAVILGGVLQILLGALKAGVIGYYFPSSVIKGMLSGIGVIIILKQIPHAFGYDGVPQGEFGFFQSDGHNTLSELSYMLDAISTGPLLIALVGMAILIVWERPFMKRISLFTVIQGPLVTVVAGVVLFVVLGGTELAVSRDHMVNIPVAESFSGFLSQFTFPDFSQLTNPRLYPVAITIAVVASLETLLCVEATDKLDPQKRITPTNRELFAQGTGNILSGLIGGLPITQVIVRSSTNIQSGGRTKLSAILHGVLILVCALAIPSVLNMIPLASLAAILIVVGYKLAKPAVFKQMHAAGREQFVPYIVTVLGIVFTDLLVGIGLGLATAIVYILWNSYKTPYNYVASAHQPGAPVTIALAQEVSFLNKASIMQTLHQLPDNTRLTIDGSLTTTIHPDVVEIIEDFRINSKDRGITVEVVGLHDRLKPPTSIAPAESPATAQTAEAHGRA